MHVGYEIRDLGSCQGVLLPAHLPGSEIPLRPLTSNSFGRARNSSAEQLSNFLIKENKSRLPQKRMGAMSLQFTIVTLVNSVFSVSCSKQMCSITCVIADDNYIQSYFYVFIVGGKQNGICTSGFFLVYANS